MRKIVMFNMVTVDGYFASTDGNIDWHVVDKEFDRWAAESMKEFDTVMLGRVTYDLFAGFWPEALDNPKTSPEDRVVAKALSEWTKVVFSKFMDKADWQPAKILHEIDEKEIKRLKSSDGKDIALYGSGTIVRQLTELGLIDEYRFMLNPVILGQGKSLFEGVKPKKLKLIDTKKFESGNVLLAYRPA